MSKFAPIHLDENRPMREAYEPTADDLRVAFDYHARDSRENDIRILDAALVQHGYHITRRELENITDTIRSLNDN
jgi:hypothetical protein